MSPTSTPASPRQKNLVLVGGAIVVVGAITVLFVAGVIRW